MYDTPRSLRQRWLDYQNNSNLDVPPCGCVYVEDSEDGILQASGVHRFPGRYAFNGPQPCPVGTKGVLTFDLPTYGLYDEAAGTPDPTISNSSGSQYWGPGSHFKLTTCPSVPVVWQLLGEVDTVNKIALWGPAQHAPFYGVAAFLGGSGSVAGILDDTQTQIEWNNIVRQSHSSMFDFANPTFLNGILSGQWLVSASVCFQANSTGYRELSLACQAGGVAGDEFAIDSKPAVNGYRTCLSASGVVTVGGGTGSFNGEFIAVVKQTSGGTLIMTMANMSVTYLGPLVDCPPPPNTVTTGSGDTGSNSISRTSLGTAGTNSGTTLTLAGVTVAAGAMLEVIVMNPGASGQTISGVTFDGAAMTQDVGNGPAGGPFDYVYRKSVAGLTTGDIVATATTTDAIALAAVEILGLASNAKDDESDHTSTTPQAPYTGTDCVTTVADTYVQIVAATKNHAGIITFPGWAMRQTVSVSSGGATFTLDEGFKILTATGNPSGLSGVTADRYACSCVAYK